MKKWIDDKYKCLVCNGVCRVVLTGLSDDRFGAPGIFDIIRCKQCHLDQLYPRPSEDELKSLYEKYYNWGGIAGTTYTNLRQRFFKSVFYRLWIKCDGDVFFHGRRGNGRLLDVGCNEGRGLFFYSKNGFKAEGIELNERAAKEAQALGFVVHNVPLHKFRSKKRYDVVVLSNVLEHSLNALSMLTTIRRMLKKSGQLWLSCPNADSLWRNVFGRHWLHWHVPFHIVHFSPVTITSLLSQAGFRVRSIKTCTPSLWLSQSLLTLMSRPGHANKAMQTAPAVGLLMFISRILLNFFQWHIDIKMKGDALMLIASPTK